ncbi:MAG: HupE/UreJ family protein [Myxococcota bacterium]
MRGGASWLVLTVAMLSCPTPAGAHTRSISDSRWTVTAEGADVRLRLSLLDLSALEGALPGTLARARSGVASPRFAEHLQARLRMLDGAGPCAPVAGSFRTLEAPEGYVRYGWRVRCAGAGPRRVHSDLLMDAVPAHLHFATVRGPDGGPEVQRVLDPSSRGVEVPRAPGPGSPLRAVGAHITLGIEHILGGWDHLVFLLALLLWSPRLRETALTVTGFTLGHSVTLGLAALGWVSPRTAAVEALIGLSIAMVAVENVWLAGGRRGPGLPAASVALLLVAAGVTAVAGSVPPLVTLGMALFAACQFGLLGRMDRPGRWRWSVASVFGLVHGFGFAGALTDLAPSSADLVPALLGFNLGVEVGQLAVVALVWPLLAWWSRRPARADWLVHAGSAAAAGAGLFWYVTRAFG